MQPDSLFPKVSEKGAGLEFKQWLKSKIQIPGYLLSFSQYFSPSANAPTDPFKKKKKKFSLTWGMVRPQMGKMGQDSESSWHLATMRGGTRSNVCYTNSNKLLWCFVLKAFAKSNQAKIEGRESKFWNSMPLKSPSQNPYRTQIASSRTSLEPLQRFF